MSAKGPIDSGGNIKLYGLTVRVDKEKITAMFSSTESAQVFVFVGDFHEAASNIPDFRVSKAKLSFDEPSELVGAQACKISIKNNFVKIETNNGPDILGNTDSPVGDLTEISGMGKWYNVPITV